MRDGVLPAGADQDRQGLGSLPGVGGEVLHEDGEVHRVPSGGRQGERVQERFPADTVPVTHVRCVPECHEEKYMVTLTRCVPYKCTRQVVECVPRTETYTATRCVCKKVAKEVPVVETCCSSPCDSCDSCDSCDGAATTSTACSAATKNVPPGRQPAPSRSRS